MDIVVYSPHISHPAVSRITYVLDWLLTERLQVKYTLTTNEELASSARYCIAYGALVPDSISIPCVTVLSADNEVMPWLNDGVKECEPSSGMWGELPMLFDLDEAGYTLPFDMLSAIFFLVTRYEEYFSFNPDKHNRYPATDSILYKLGVLHRPIVDEWIETFRQLAETTWNAPIEKPVFSFKPTYDIDMAYSHANKGIARIVGAYMKAFIKGDVAQINERTQVLKKKQKDPYDSFAWLHRLHDEYRCHPIYFILCALRTTAFDKNIHPQHPAMKRIIKQIAKDGETGIHPSYFSDTDDMAAKEQNVLESIIGHNISISRQHYIKLDVPVTLHRLIDNGIADDYSMGYGTHLGFRAGTGNSFLWYDLQNEKVTNLRLHPFCFMDTTAHYELRLTIAEAFTELHAMEKILRHTGSSLVTIFHNFSLGTAQEWNGWSTAYEVFINSQMTGVKDQKDQPVHIG